MKTLVELFSKPGTWCQGPMAKDADGNDCDWRDEQAVQFCLWGAQMKVCGGCGGAGYWEIDKKLEQAVKSRGYNYNFINWNEEAGRTQEEVLALCQEAGV